eukprot:5649789-Lingulodinium_polyedra.AAC.1
MDSYITYFVIAIVSCMGARQASLCSECQPKKKGRSTSSMRGWEAGMKLCSDAADFTGAGVKLSSSTVSSGSSSSSSSTL